MIVVVHALFALAQSVTPGLAELERMFNRGEMEQGREAARQLAADPNATASALLALGRLLGTSKEFLLAEEAFQRASRLNPGAFEAHFNLGLTRFQMRNFATAIAPLETAASLRPRAFEPNYLLGVTLNEAGRKADAIRCLRSAAEINPRHPRLLALLGALYAGEGYSLDAVEVLEQARAIDPGQLPVSLLLIQALHDSFDFEHALRLASETAGRFKTSADAQFRLAVELETAGRFDEARDTLTAALAIDARHPGAMVALGRMQAREGRPAEAIANFRAVLAAQPGNALARIEAAKAYLALKQFAAARDILAPIEAQRDPTLHWLLSIIHAAEGDQTRAATHRNRFLELSSALAGGMGNTPGRRPRRYGQ